MKIHFDDGYSFGIGLFETIHLHKNKPLFLKEHLERLNNSIDIFKINCSKILEIEIYNYLKKFKEFKENEVLKIMVSEKNKIFLKRDYKYSEEIKNKGFKINISQIKRNETSIFTYHKTLNYAENIYEKRNSFKLGYDEPIFFNNKGYLTEGATTNIFLIKDKKIYTPKISQGLLNGVIRNWILSNYEVEEIEIKFEDLKNFDEVFLTNSLMGIMPVVSIDNIHFELGLTTKKISKNYEEIIKF